MSDGPMIQKFVRRFDAARPALLARFKEKHPESYEDIVRAVVEVVGSQPDDDWTPSPDAGRIHRIDDGHYQGTLVFVIGAKGYQPSEYWYVLVSYGSCSGCDTLEAIRHYDDDAPTEAQAADYLTLALHIVQGLRPMFQGEA